MKKSHTIYLCVLLFTILSAPVFGNSGKSDKNVENSNNQLTLDEQVDLNIQALGIGLGFKKRVYKALFLGLEGGGGLTINYWFDISDIRNHNGTILEKYYISSGVFYIPTPNVQIYLGIAKAGIRLDEIKSQDNTAWKFDFFIGTKKLKYGIKLTGGKDEKKRQFLYSSLLAFKISLNK